MKILFIGSVKFSKKMFDEINITKNKIVGVIGKKYTSFNSDYFDMVKYASGKKIKSINVKNINSEKTRKWIISKKPDVIFCMGWSKLLKKRIIKIPKHGVIGFHPSDLPLNRGRHPIIWALALGLKKTAATFFLIDENADTGNIISKKIIKISKNDDAKSIYTKMITTAKKQIRIILKKIETDNLKSKKQIKKNSNFWRKRSEIDGKIDWRMSAESIYNLVRALSKPYPGAFFQIINNKKITVWKSKIIKVKLINIEPGKFLFFDKKKPVVKCGENAIKLEEFSPKINFKRINYL
jgi:methionyl-tRNA formyltransferase